MASILKVDDLRGNTAAGDITITSEGGAATQSLQQGLAKAWINFNGTGTIATRDSFSVSSISDNGTGDTTLTFSNVFNNADYSQAGSSGGQGSTSNGAVYPYDNATARTSSILRVLTFGTSGASIDTPIVQAHIMGDLA
jgi:hypothetical protein